MAMSRVARCFMFCCLTFTQSLAPAASRPVFLSHLLPRVRYLGVVQRSKSARGSGVAGGPSNQELRRGLDLGRRSGVADDGRGELANRRPRTRAAVGRGADGSRYAAEDEEETLGESQSTSLDSQSTIDNDLV